MKLPPLFRLAALAVLPGSGALQADDMFRVTAPPAAVVQALDLSPFYKKHVDVAGFSVVSSDKVADAALLEAAWIIRHELEGRDNILEALAANKVRCAVMARDEFTTAIPEHSTLRPAQYWDKRARGLGASRERPAVSCAEENLLCYPGDPYGSENILIHEFAHAIHQMALNTMDSTFDGRLQEVYEGVIKRGLWKNTYAASNKSEYWAEGVQSWFDTNRENDRQHNHVNTRAELKVYDPGLSMLLTEVFGDRAWRYQKPQDRPAGERAHLAGWDAAKSPRFAWPQALLDWNANTLRRAMIATDEYAAVPLTPLGAAGATASRKGGGESSLHFFNQRGTEVHLRWVDPKGEQHAYGLIAPTGDLMQHTFAGHSWLITDETDRPLGQCIALEKAGKVVIE